MGKELGLEKGPKRKINLDSLRATLKEVPNSLPSMIDMLSK